MWCFIWLIVMAICYDFYSQNNDIRCLLILIIPFVLQIVSMICDVKKAKYKSVLVENDSGKESFQEE